MVNFSGLLNDPIALAGYMAASGQGEPGRELAQAASISLAHQEAQAQRMQQQAQMQAMATLPGVVEQHRQNPGALAVALLQRGLEPAAVKSVISNMFPKPMSAVGKVQYDISQGVLPEDIGRAALLKSTTHAPGTTVSINNAPYQKELQKSTAARVDAVGQRADAATGLLQDIDVMEGAMQDVGYTGRFGEVYHELDKILFDWLPGRAGSRELFRSKATESLGRFINETKGAISNAEMEIFAKASPGLTTSKEGNEKILKAMRGIEIRNLEQEQFYNEWARNTGDLTGAAVAWNKYVNENPIFKDKSLTINKKSLGKWQNYLPRTAPPAGDLDTLLYNAQNPQAAGEVDYKTKYGLE